jgi:hypothetical protein
MRSLMAISLLSFIRPKPIAHIHSNSPPNLGSVSLRTWEHGPGVKSTKQVIIMYTWNRPYIRLLYDGCEQDHWYTHQNTHIHTHTRTNTHNLTQNIHPYSHAHTHTHAQRAS